MADDKKPKIDLKARLGKMGGAATPPPSPVQPGGPGGSIPAPPMAAPPIAAALPAPPGAAPSPFAPPTPAAGLDPSNPLAAAAAGTFNPNVRAQVAAPAQPQRIEVDESAVQEARAKARKQGVVIAGLVGLVFAGVGYVAGGAMEQNAGRSKSKKDAAELAGDVTKAKDTLKSLAEKMEAGRDQLLKERKYPDALAKELGGLNVDFDGSKLAGRRFSGFPQDTTSGLVELITAVQQVNDRKLAVINLLNKLQKPLTDQLSAPAGQQRISQVIVVDKDPGGNPSAFLASLVTPINATAAKIDLPEEFTFANPRGNGNVKLPRYRGGDIASKPAAVYVVPKSFDSACPAETSGQLAQLGAQISGFIREIRGEQAAAGGDAVVDTKPGLMERADKLAVALTKVTQQP